VEFETLSAATNRCAVINSPVNESTTYRNIAKEKELFETLPLRAVGEYEALDIVL
jgi:hypothetical protein